MTNPGHRKMPRSTLVSEKGYEHRIGGCLGDEEREENPVHVDVRWLESPVVTNQILVLSGLL